MLKKAKAAMSEGAAGDVKDLAQVGARFVASDLARRRRRLHARAKGRARRCSNRWSSRASNSSGKPGGPQPTRPRPRAVRRRQQRRRCSKWRAEPGTSWSRCSRTGSPARSASSAFTRRTTSRNSRSASMRSPPRSTSCSNRGERSRSRHRSARRQREHNAGLEEEHGRKRFGACPEGAGEAAFRRVVDRPALQHEPALGGLFALCDSPASLGRGTAAICGCSRRYSRLSFSTCFT